MRDLFDDVLKDMRELVKDAPPDGRITLDTLEHFLVRLERMADDSKRLDWIAMYGSYGADSVSGTPTNGARTMTETVHDTCSCGEPVLVDVGLANVCRRDGKRPHYLGQSDDVTVFRCRKCMGWLGDTCPSAAFETTRNQAPSNTRVNASREAASG